MRKSKPTQTEEHSIKSLACILQKYQFHTRQRLRNCSKLNVTEEMRLKKWITKWKTWFWTGSCTRKTKAAVRDIIWTTDETGMSYG